MPVDKKVEPKVKPKRSTRASSADKSPPSAPRRSTRASSADKSPPPPASSRQSLALSKIPEESQKKPSTPSKTKILDEVPTAGTPKRRGRASLNPTPAAVASPVRVTRRSVAALVEETVPVVSSPRRKSRASINPSIASPARVTRNSLAAQVEESESQAERSPTRSRRKSMLPKGKLETDDKDEAENESSSTLAKVEESPENGTSTNPNEIEKDTKPSQLPAADRTPEPSISTQSRQSNQSGSGSADDKTPESKIPTRRSTPTGPGNASGEFRTPTRSHGGSRPSTPSSRPGTPVSKNIADLKGSTKPSPDRHANCSSRDSSPVFTPRDLRRSSLSSPRHSPRSSPTRQPRLSLGESKVPSPISTGLKPTSPLASGQTATPTKLKNDQASKSSPLTAKAKETAVPEKHSLEDEDDTLMPNKRIKRDPADENQATLSSNNEKECSPKKKLSYSSESKQEGGSGDASLDSKPENEPVDPAVVVEAISEGSDKETKYNGRSIPGITKISTVQTSPNDVKEEDDHLKNGTVSDREGVKKQTSPKKELVPGELGEAPSTVGVRSDEETKSTNNEITILGITKICDVGSSSNDVKVTEEDCCLEQQGAVSDGNLVKEHTLPKKELGSEEHGEGPSTVASKQRGEEPSIPTDEAKTSSLDLKNDSTPSKMAHSGDKLDVVGEEAVENEISSSSDNPRVGELKRQDTFVMENTSTKDGASSDIAEARSTEAPEERRRDEVTTSKDEGRIECPVLNSNSPAENVDSKSAEEVQQKDDSPLQDATAESRSSVDVNPGDEQVGEEDEEHQELEQSIIIRDSNFTGVEDNEELSVTPAPCESEGNRKSVELEETVVEVGDEEQQDSEQSSDTSVTGVEGCIDPNKSKAVASESPDVPEDVTQNDENPLVVSAYQCDSEEGKISNQCEAAESHSPAKSPHTPEKDKSFEDSSAQLEPEEANISDQGDTTNIDKFSAIDNSSDIPEVTSETTESLDSTVIQSTTEHILVDEGYSETSDSDYHSSGKDVKVPSIVEGLGINEVEKDSKITVNLASQSEELITQSRTILDDIVEEDEDYSEIKSVVQSKDDVEELKLAVSDEASEIVSTNGTNVEAAVDEQENTDHSGFASPLRLAVSPEPSNNVEDDSPSKDEIACPALKSPAKDVAASVTVSHVDKELKENIDTTTVLGKLGLRKHVEFSQTNEICEGENEQDDECGPEIYENDTTSVGDTDEEKRDEATSKNNEDSHCKGEDVKEMEKVSQENGHEIYENDTDSDGGNDDADEPVVTYSGANFIDDEAEEGEETEDESDDENIIYDETEESDSSDSDVELLDQSNFILDEAKERRLSFKKPSHDSVVILDVTSHEVNDGSDDESSKEKAGRVDFDESCYIVEEPTGNEQPIRTSPESKISPKADKPVFEISEIADSGKTVAQKVNEFASGAASQFVTERTKGEPLKSIFKTSKGFKNANAYASAAASQFVVSEDAIKQKHEKKPLKAKGSASTGSPKSDSSDQENTNRAPKTKKRPAAETEAEALKEKKKSRLDNTVPGFCVKLCNVAPNTHIDVLREALGKFGIASGLQSLEFCPTSDKRKKTAIAIYNSKKNLEKALSNYGKVVVQGRRIFFLLDDETVPAGDQNQLNTASPKKSPRKKFVGIIGNLAENITIGDICSAYEEEGIKFLNKVKLYKMRSSKDNFAQLEFSKKTALLKAIIVTEKIRIKGNKIVLKIKEKPTAAP